MSTECMNIAQALIPHASTTGDGIAGHRTAPATSRSDSRWKMAIALTTIIAAAALLSGCATQASVETAAPATTAPGAHFLLVRHAEKAADDAKDPNLSEAGRARAERLRTHLSAGTLEAVYATAYKRTRQTAGPAAAAHGLNVTTYDASQPAAEFAAQLRRTHVPAEGTRPVVLIVGHSNTVPALAAALCGCAIEPMTDDEFDRIITISFNGDDIRTQQQRY